MLSPRMAAIIVGALFWISNVAVLVGSAISGPILNDPNYPSLVYPRRAQVVVGVLVAAISDVAIIGYGIVLYTVLKKRSEVLALGYLTAKIVESIVLAVGAASIVIWGVITLGLLTTGLVLGIPDPTHGFQPGQLLVVPIILWELFFATWLIARGFTPSAIAAL